MTKWRRGVDRLLHPEYVKPPGRLSLEGLGKFQGVRAAKYGQVMDLVRALAREPLLGLNGVIERLAAIEKEVGQLVTGNELMLEVLKYYEDPVSVAAKVGLDKGWHEREKDEYRKMNEMVEGVVARFLGGI